MLKNKVEVSLITNALLAGALVCVIIPQFAWMAPLLSILILAIYYLKDWIPSRSIIYVPDPLVPEFRSLLEELATRIAIVSQQGKPHAIYLTTYCNQVGKTIPYAINWDSKKSTLMVISQGRKERLEIDCKPLFLLPLPILVDRPKSLYLSQIKVTERCTINEGCPYIRDALNLLIFKTTKTLLYRIYLIILSIVWLFINSDGRLGFFRFVTLAISPIIILQLILFYSRIQKGVLSFFRFTYLVLRHRILAQIFKLFNNIK